MVLAADVWPVFTAAAAAAGEPDGVEPDQLGVGVRADPRRWFLLVVLVGFTRDWLTCVRSVRNAVDMESTHRDASVGRLLSVGEACEMLNVSRQLIYRLVASNRLPVVKLGDRTLFRPRDLEALIARSVRLGGSPE
jgi:excisionase family DNA binding protein